MATFRCNTSKYRETCLTPYRAMFGVDGLQLRLDDEPEDLAERLGRIHKDLLSAGRRTRTQAVRYYD
jgi:hypothetical protein